MKDAVAFLAFMRGLVPDSTVSLTLGDSGLTVTISNRVTGRWYGYILDADDLEKPSAGLADELVRIHENRSHGDDKHPIRHNREGDHDLRITNSERFVIRELLSVATITATGSKAGYFVHKCEKQGLNRGDALALADAFDIDVPEELWGRYEADPSARAAKEGSVQVVNTNTATADEREHAALTLEASQRAFLKAWGWTSNGTGLWADPWKEVVNFAWDGDMAVAEQNNRKEGVSSSSPPLRGKGDARPTYSIADSMKRIREAVRTLPGNHTRSPSDTLTDLEDVIIAELKRARAEGNP